MRLLGRLMAVSLMMLSFIMILPVYGADAVVTDCVNFTGAGSLGDALTTANAGGGTITFNCGGPATITIPAQQGIGANVIIDGANQITLSGGGTNRLFSMAGVGSILTLRNITVISGNANAGGAIYVSSEFVAENVTFSGNTANGLNGGAIRNFGTTTITNSIFTGNNATQNGGAIANDGTLTITNSTFTGNLAIDGGAIRNDGTLTINNSTFTGNSASSDGGAIFNLGTLTISNSTFTGNSVSIFDGGAIDNVGTLTISNSTFMGNSASGVGGAIDHDTGTLTISNSIFTGNSAGLYGDAIANAGTTSSQDSYYENNTCFGTITDNGGNTVLNAVGCPGTEVTTSPEPVAPTVTVLGCALDSADGVEVANAPDNTYCRILMKNGGVVSYSGAIPADLIGLGVKLAVDVYRLEGGASVNTFPAYAQVCLAGEGRLFYMDSRNAPRVSIELATEQLDGMTCGWIPAPGTLILTN